MTISVDQRCQRRWYPLRYHPVQAALWNSPARFKVVPAGRRSGKTELAKRCGVRKACGPQRYPNARYIFAAPTHLQAKWIFWRDVKLLVPPERLAGSRKESISEVELTIRLWNEAQIIVCGLDKAERLEGPPIDWICIDEYANVKKEVWDHHIRPALSERAGEAWLIGVPEGRNHYYQLAMLAQGQMQEHPDLWGYFTWHSADILVPEEIAIARSELDERTFRQEYEGSFETFEGRVYYAFDRELHLDESIQYDRELPLILALDFNVSPGVAAILQEVEIARPDGRRLSVTRVVDEIWIEDNSTTIRVCEEFCRRYRTHPGAVHLYGDATGGVSGTAQVAGSDWDLVQAVLGPVFRDRLRSYVEWRNPPQRVRVNCVNSRLQSADGNVWLKIAPQCLHTIRDFEGVVYARGTGEIDKKTDPALTHLTDAIGYFIYARHPLSGGRAVTRQM